MLGVTAPAFQAQGRAMSVEQVMAGIIMQLPLVVTWSSKKQNKSGTIQMCATSPSGVGNTIRSMLAANARGTVVRYFDNVSEAQMPFCHILFVNESNIKTAQRYINLVRGHGVMTVGVSKGFVSSGGVLGFLESSTQLGLFSKSKVRFDINISNARYERLSLDPLLLELAEEVRR